MIMTRKKQILSCAVSFLGIYALPGLMGFTGEQIYLTNSIFLFAAWIGLSVLIGLGMDRVDWRDLRADLLALFLACAFSACMAVGSDHCLWRYQKDRAHRMFFDLARGGSQGSMELYGYGERGSGGRSGLYAKDISGCHGGAFAVLAARLSGVLPRFFRV